MRLGHRELPEPRDNEQVTQEPRPPRPTLQQVRDITQPPEIVTRANSEHWLGIPYFRKVSPFLTRWFILWSISPNAVTYLMIVVGASASFALLVPGVFGAMLGALLAQLQMIVDCCDGEVARWQQKYSPLGFFLDKVAHYVAEGLVPLAIGIRAAGGLAIFHSETMSWWPWLGAVVSLLVVWNKALNDAVHVARAHNGLAKLIESPSVNAPTISGLQRIRSLTKFFPFQRIFHSVEMTFLAFLASIADAVLGGLAATQFALSAVFVLICITLVGHFVSIVTSSRLR